MKKKDRTINREARVLIALVIAFLYLSSEISRTPGIILISISNVLLIISFINFNTLYFLLGIKSAKNKI